MKETAKCNYNEITPYVTSTQGVFFNMTDKTYFVSFEFLAELRADFAALTALEKELAGQLLHGYCSWGLDKIKNHMAGEKLHFCFSIKGTKKGYTTTGTVTVDVIEHVTDFLMKIGMQYRSYDVALYDTLAQLSPKKRNKYLYKNKEAIEKSEKSFGIYQILSGILSSSSDPNTFDISIEHHDWTKTEKERIAEMRGLTVGFIVRDPPEDIAGLLDKYEKRSSRYMDNLLAFLSQEGHRYGTEVSLTYDEFKELMGIKKPYQLGECIDLLNLKLATRWKSIYMAKKVQIKPIPEEKRLVITYRLYRNYLAELEKE